MLELRQYSDSDDIPLIVVLWELESGTSMSDERMREKTMQIVALNQKLEALQAQLSGSQRRCTQLGERVAELEGQLGEKSSEVQLLTSELSKTKGALDSVGREMQGIRAEQTQMIAKKQPKTDTAPLMEEMEIARRTIQRLEEELKQFSAAANSVLNDEQNAAENLRRVLLEFGDPQFRILNLVLSKKSVRVDEIASQFLMDTESVLEVIDTLEAADEVELQDGRTVIPARKYREIAIPDDEWRGLEPIDLFSSLEEFVGKTDDAGTIARAIDTSVEILEQKLARSGALMFQMRRTADTWKKQSGSTEELRYTIKEWKARAQALG